MSSLKAKKIILHTRIFFLFLAVKKIFWIINNHYDRTRKKLLLLLSSYLSETLLPKPRILAEDDERNKVSLKKIPFIPGELWEFLITEYYAVPTEHVQWTKSLTSLSTTKNEIVIENSTYLWYMFPRTLSLLYVKSGRWKYVLQEDPNKNNNRQRYITNSEMAFHLDTFSKYLYR